MILEQQEPGFGLKVNKNLNNFYAGGLLGKIDQWQQITADQEILNIIRFGASLKFNDMAPSNIPFEYGRSGKDRDIIQSEIHSLLQSGVISKSEGEGGYFSNIFTRPKSDGSARIILNLKSINPNPNSCKKAP